MGIGFARFLLVLLIPAYGFCEGARFRFRGWPMLAWVGMLGVGLAFLGQSWVVLVFGCLVGIHAMGILTLLAPGLARCSLGLRLAFGLAVVSGLIGLLYLPARGWMENRFFRPVRVGDQVVVLRPGGDSSKVRRGDWVAVDLAGQGSEGVRIREGLMLAPVLGLAGDRIEFGPGTFRINGEAHPALDLMPAEGSLTVPAESWFIWPRLQMTWHGNVAPELVSAALSGRSLVFQGRLVGRPFDHWFFRRQILR